MFGVLLGPRKTEPQAYIYVQTHIKILIQKLKRVISLDMVNGQYSNEVRVLSRQRLHSDVLTDAESAAAPASVHL